jgi:hypothetical protein
MDGRRIARSHIASSNQCPEGVRQIIEKQGRKLAPIPGSALAI